MAVSGVANFTVTRDDIIKASLRLLGVIGVGESPIAEDYTNCSQALNIMIKSWSKKGFPLWTYEELVLPAVPGIIEYPIGPTAGFIGLVTSTGGTDYTEGTWEAVGGTTGTVASGTYTVVDGAPDVFTIDVPGDSYTEPPTSFTLSGDVNGDADIVGTVVGLTRDKPLKITHGFIRTSANLDTNIFLISRQEYDFLGNKLVPGVINQFHYDDQLETGYIYVFNEMALVGSALHFLTQRQFFDMTTGTDNFDFPQEWFQCLKWGLAAELSVEYNIEPQLISYYDQKAEMYLMECFDSSVEEASIYFTIGGAR